MRLSHADFRPGKRPRFVPSGSPRRKVPLIRIVLLIGLGIFVYTQFDSMWSRVRSAASSSKIWHALTGGSDERSETSLTLSWSRDSSRVTLECPLGLNADCCESLARADGDLCGEASALIGKARWHGALREPRSMDQPLRLEGRAVVSDLGDWGFELSDLRGRDASGKFLYRRAAGSPAWCDASRGCLKPELPRAPMPGGRLTTRTLSALETTSSHDGATSVWVSTSPRVRAVLPGRIVAVETAVAAASKDTAKHASAYVRVYHGGERYATYGPLQAAQGVKAGVMVKTGSHLGDALENSATGDYSLTVRLRHGGRPADAETFWGVRSAPVEPADPSAADNLLSASLPQ